MFEGPEITRVDLHLHSRASGTASNWWVRGLGADVEVRESYTLPEDSYHMARRAGMDFVTLTDHETIEGALTLVHHADFFASEEVNARFPEDGNFVDVLVYGVDEEIHRETQARRQNVYELVEYLREAGVVHALAHPLYGMPGPLGRDQIEKRLVLFGLWELINGSRPAVQNRLAAEISYGIEAADLRQMAQRHGLPAPPHDRVAGTAGSDDHGGIYGGAAFTVTPKVGSPKEFLAALAAGEVWPGGADGSVEKMTQTGFGIAGAALTEGKEEGAMRLFGGIPEVLRRFGGRRYPAKGRKVFAQVPLLARKSEPEIRTVLAGRYEERVAEALNGLGSGFPVVDLLSSVGDLIDGHLFVAPYLGVHGYFGHESRKARILRRELFPKKAAEPNVGIFVDGLDAVHGVATMYSNILAHAAQRHSGEISIVRCGPGEVERMTTLRQIATLPVPLYDGLTLGVPSLLEVFDHVAREGYDVLHVATPGPLGLATLIAGLSLGVPVVGAYHTELGAYARMLSGDEIVAEVVEVAVREFYERCSAVAVPSQATALALRNRGYRIQRFEILKNGVDTDLFSPERRDEALRDSLGSGRALLLYAGRISREKDLAWLAEGYMKLRARRDDAHLVIAGDGPYRKELEAKLGPAATFTGFLKGEELARLFASCDLFVFPSTTDTLGRAVAEAQASGLPAVVRGIGGPRECIRPGVSGYVAEPDEEAGFFERIEALLDDPAARKRMGVEAREFAGTLSWEGVLDALMELHASVVADPGADRLTAVR